MGFRYPVPNAEQKELLQRIDIDADNWIVVLDNDRVLWLRHLKTRIDITISKQ